MKGHNLFTNLVGMTFEDSNFADLSGWKFLTEDRNAAFSPEGNGWIRDLIWTDEFWPGNGNMQISSCYSQIIDRAAGLSAVTCAANAEVTQ